MFDVTNFTTENIQDGGTLNTEISSNNVSVDGGGEDDVIFSSDSNSSIAAGAGDDIVGGGEGNDTITGQEGNDIVAGLGGSDDLRGGKGNDTLTGGAISLSDNRLYVTADTTGIDTLTGGEGEDLFVLGGESSSTSGEIIIHYDQAGNNDYALITDFDKIQDVINLGGSIDDYHLGSSPTNLPEGTALYRDDELIAIIQGSSDLGLSGDYFNF